MKTFGSACLLAVAATLCMPAAPQAVTARPEQAGMSSDRLGRLDGFLSRMQAEGKLAGAVTAVVRRGTLVSLKAHGFADLETKRPMQADAIFQIQSMTKPIATVAVLMLMEEGRLQLADPVAKFLPEFAGVQTPHIEPAKQPGQR